MRQFQGSLGPIQDLQPKGRPRPPTLEKNGSAADWGREISKPHANDDPWTGWKLVCVWTLAAAVPWAVLYVVGRALYNFVVWLAP